MEQEKPAPKKRGRKPKNYNPDADANNSTTQQPAQEKEVKRRGRKPTCKIYENKPFDEEQLANIQETECVIVHLPISKKDIEGNTDFTENSETNPIQVQSIPSLNTTIQNIMTSETNNTTPITKLTGESSAKLSMQKQTLQKSLSNGECQKCHEHAKEIKNLKMKLQLSLGELEKKTLKSCIKLENIYDGSNLWEYDNNICCRWCLHDFESIPIGLPETYNSECETYHVINCYCSFNCALAHNLTMTDYNMLHRVSLLYHMRNAIMSNIHEDFDERLLDPIIPAPPQDMLDIFSGPLSVDDFRKTSLVLKKQYIQHMPNVVSIEKSFEESINTKQQKTKAKSKKNKNSDLVLMRPNKQPTTSNENVNSTMDLINQSTF